MRRLAHKHGVLRTYGAWRRSPFEALRFLLSSRELDNFTYEIANINELTTFVADVLGCPRDDVARALDELAGDRELEVWLRERLSSRTDRNRWMPYGRRIGWYALVRLTRPRLVVETGVHDGLGSTVLLRALERNAADGVSGELASFDTRSDVGWLIPDALRSRHQLVIGDALERLRPVVNGREVGLFIHDSDHRYEHERAELELVTPMMGPQGLLVSDNAHAVTALADHCVRTGLEFHFWREVPRGHFYPGAGIGLGLRR
jgi:predicted O-methyltransferase YrrM